MLHQKSEAQKKRDSKKPIRSEPAERPERLAGAEKLKRPEGNAKMKKAKGVEGQAKSKKAKSIGVRAGQGKQGKQGKQADQGNQAKQGKSLSNSVQQKRLKRASLLLLFAFVFVAASAAVEGYAQEGVFASAWNALQLPRSVAVVSNASLPVGFEEEVLRVSEHDGLCVSSNAKMLSFALNENASQALENLSKELEAKGWVSVGVVNAELPCMSFVKAEGRYRWLLLQSIQIDKASCVLVQYECEDGGNEN